MRFSTNQGAHSETSLTPSLREALTWYFGTCEKQNNALDLLWLSLATRRPTSGALVTI